MNEPARRDTLAIVIPMLNEAAALPRLARTLAVLDPPADEIIAVDGGSADASMAIARQAGWRVLAAPTGRARQINAGVGAARAVHVCILHADTLPPPDLVAVIGKALADHRTALVGFIPLIRGPGGVRVLTSFHNWIKTWYAPLLFRPRLFLKGGRLLFGDHAMSFRRADFHAVGGCDERAEIMEDADLCIRLARQGRVRLIARFIETSDRRVAQWGTLKANWIYLKIGFLWGIGRRRGLARHYPDVR